MIQLFQDIWNEVIVRLWNYGTRTARLVIRVAILVIVFGVVIPLLIWPFVLLGVSFVDWYLDLGTWLTAVAALFPLAAFLFFVIASSTILILAYPLMSAILAAIPRVRSFSVWLVIAIAVAVFAELVLGLYLAFVPVWSWPWLIAGLVLLTVVLGMWLFLNRQLRWQWGGWVTPLLATAIVVVTIVFFFVSWFGSDKAEVKAAGKTEAVEVPRIEEFTLKADEEVDTVATGPGTQHRVSANNDWILVSATADGTLREYRMAAGRKSIVGTSVEGPARVKSVQDGTTIRFERVR